MLEYAVNIKRPIVIRYPRGGEGKEKFKEHNKIETGKAELIKQGEDISIIAIGKMVSRAMEIAKKLEENKINAEVINARFLKPLDEETILNSIIKTKNVITIEDNIAEGGLGTKVIELVQKNNLKDIQINKFGYPDKFIKHGTTDELEKIYGLDTQSIIQKITNISKCVLN